MSDIDRQIQSKVHGFVTELSALVRKAAVEAVATALGSRAAHAAPGPKSGPRRGRKPGPAKKAVVVAAAAKALRAKRKPGEKRSKVAIARTTDRLLEHIKANKGQGIEAIAKALNTTTKELTLPVKKLLATKRISSQGQKRATRYFVR